MSSTLSAARPVRLASLTHSTPSLPLLSPPPITPPKQQIVKSPPPSWEVEHQAWRQERQLASGQLKRYPQLGDARQRTIDGADAGEGAAAAAAGPSSDSSSADAPSTASSFETPADARGDVRTMKRRLRDKLVLIVKGGGGSGGGGSSSGGRWQFPAAEHREGETIRATAERALRQTIGLPPLFFIGNAPMAHLEEEEKDGGKKAAAAATTTTFFHLAQVLNDPWEVELAREGGAVDYAWVAPDELDKYLGKEGAAGGAGGGKALLDLTRRML